MRPTGRAAATLAAAAIIVSACGESAADSTPVVESTVAPAPEEATSAGTDEAVEADTTESAPAETTAADAPAADATEAADASDTESTELPAENPLLTGVVPTVTGSQIDLASFTGQDVLVWVWAPW